MNKEQLFAYNKNNSSYYIEVINNGVKIPKKTKPQRPTRDEFELEELGSMLAEAFQDKTLVNLTVWEKGEVQQT